MFLEHPNYTMLTDLLNADDNEQPEVANWHEAQEAMERRAFARGADRRVSVQIRISRRILFQQEIVAVCQVIAPEIIAHVMESDSAVLAIGQNFMSHEISAGVKRIVVQQGLCAGAEIAESAEPTNLMGERPAHLGRAPNLPKSSINREELDAIFDEPEEDHLDGREAVRPSYIGGRPAALKGQISREELNAILDAPDVSILDEIEEENKKVVRQDSPSLKTHSAVKDVDEEPDKKRKKQKFVQKGRDFGHGGRSDRKRGRNGPTGFH